MFEFFQFKFFYLSFISLSDFVCLFKAHQTLARHDVVSCPNCKALMPTRECLMVHREFETKGMPGGSPNKFSTPNSSDSTKPISFLCLACFERLPAANFTNHAKEHMNKDGVPISCNECFELITWPKNIDRHDSCFQKEALRSQIDASVCKECSYKCENKTQLNRHFGWCHRPLKCKYCPTEVC